MNAIEEYSVLIFNEIPHHQKHILHHLLDVNR